MKFFQMIQDHERSWGETEYTGRPTLEKLLESAVVVFWRTTKDQRYIAVCHNDIDDVGKQMARQILLSDKTDRTVAKIFNHQKPMRISSVSVEFAEDTES